MMHILMNSVLKNVWIWGMALTYFFIYVIRQGVTSWSIFFLMNQKGVPDAGSAGFMVSGLEARAPAPARPCSRCGAAAPPPGPADL